MFEKDKLFIDRSYLLYRRSIFSIYRFEVDHLALPNPTIVYIPKLIRGKWSVVLFAYKKKRIVKELEQLLKNRGIDYLIKYE